MVTLYTVQEDIYLLPYFNVSGVSKKKISFAICCEWKMATDKLDSGRVLVSRNFKLFQCFL